MSTCEISDGKFSLVYISSSAWSEGTGCAAPVSADAAAASLYAAPWTEALYTFWCCCNLRACCYWKRNLWTSGKSCSRTECLEGSRRMPRAISCTWRTGRSSREREWGEASARRPVATWSKSWPEFTSGVSIAIYIGIDCSTKRIARRWAEPELELKNTNN